MKAKIETAIKDWLGLESWQRLPTFFDELVEELTRIAEGKGGA